MNKRKFGPIFTFWKTFGAILFTVSLDRHSYYNFLFSVTFTVTL